ncbi:MAG: response regulator, partial [Gemmatimonadaceae bacterium]
MTAIRVFIADDHPIVRQGLRRIVEADSGLKISGEADNAAAVVAGVAANATDLVLLDVSMPGGHFLDTLRELRERHPTIRVLVLSVHAEDQWAVRALRAGASGYLTKDHSPDQLLEAIRRVYRGGKYVSPTLAEQLASQLDPGAQRAPHELLSDREFEVMRRIGSGLTLAQ